MRNFVRRTYHFSGPIISLILILGLFGVAIPVSSLEAGNVTSGGNVTSPGNMTGLSGARVDFEEGMKSIKSQNISAAISHFNSATDALANTTTDTSPAIKLIREGVRLLESGDIAMANQVMDNASKLLK
jgi:hypothetical protein